MTSIAHEKHKSGAQFSGTGQEELTELHALVLTGFGLARHVLLVDDIEAARRLVLDKAEVKRRERSSRKAHLKRLEAVIQTALLPATCTWKPYGRCASFTGTLPPSPIRSFTATAKCLKRGSSPR